MQAGGYLGGVAMVVLAAVLWSTMGVAIRNLDEMNTWQVLFWRSLGMIPVLAAFVWWRAGPALFRDLRGIGLAGLLGALGLVAAFGGAIFAIQRLPLANAVFLFSAAPFLTALLSMIILKERVRPATWAAIAIAGLGIWLMIGATSLTDGAMIGNLAALGSAMGFSVFTVALRSGKGGEMLPTVILLWLPPVVQEFSDLCACDRLRSSFRPRCAAFPEAAGRHGDQRIRSKSWGRTLGSKFDYGFPDPDLFDRCAHSGHSSLTLPLAPTLVITT